MGPAELRAALEGRIVEIAKNQKYSEITKRFSRVVLLCQGEDRPQKPQHFSMILSSADIYSLPIGVWRRISGLMMRLA
jgi:hypothetical protein